MTIKKITAIINEMQLDNVAKALCEHGVTGFTIHPVSGRGNYCNTFSDSEGLVAITTVDELFWVYQQTPAQIDDFNFNDVLGKNLSGGNDE